MMPGPEDQAKTNSDKSQDSFPLVENNERSGLIFERDTSVGSDMRIVLGYPKPKESGNSQANYGSSSTTSHGTAGDARWDFSLNAGRKRAWRSLSAGIFCCFWPRASTPSDASVEDYPLVQSPHSAGTTNSTVR